MIKIKPKLSNISYFHFFLVLLTIAPTTVVCSFPDSLQNKTTRADFYWYRDDTFTDSKIANFTIEPKYLRSYFHIKIDSTDIDFKKFEIIIWGYSNNENVEILSIDSITKNKWHTVKLKKHSGSAENLDVEYRAYFRIKGLDKPNHYFIDYQIKIEQEIFSIKQLIYLAINILLCIIIIITSREKVASIIINYNWKDSLWAKLTDGTARILIIILIIDEIGLALKEWGYNISVFRIFSEFIKVPGISYAIFVANFVIIIPATYRIVIHYHEKLRENKIELLKSFQSIEDFESYKNHYALLTSLLILSISLIIWDAQCLIWGEYDTEGASFNNIPFWLNVIPPFLMMFTLFIFLTKRMSVIGLKYRTNTSKLSYSKRSAEIFYTITFISFSQTMITKVLILLPLINKFQLLSSKLLGLIPPKRYLSEEMLLPFSPFKKWREFNFSFLVSLFIIFIIFWQLVITPFPPLESFYPKGMSISILYTLIILLYFIINTNDRFYRIKSILFQVLTIFVIYLTPLLFIDWYINIKNYGDDFYFLRIFHQMNFLLPGILLFFLLNLLILFSITNLFSNLIIEEKLYDGDFSDSTFFRKYLWRIQLYPILLRLSFIFIFMMVLLSHYLPQLWIASGIFDMTGLFIIPFLPIIYLIYELLDNSIQRIYKRIKKIGGDEIVNQLIQRNRFLLLFKSWNNNKINPKGVLLFLLVSSLIWGIFYVPLGIIPHLLNKSAVKFEWINEYNEHDMIHNFVLVKNKILMSSSNKLICADKFTGKEIWSYQSNYHFFEVISDSLIWINGRDDVCLLSLDNRKIYSFVHKDKENIPTESFRIFDKYALIKDKSRFIVLDAYSNRKIFEKDDLNGYLPHYKGGPLIWKDKNNIVWSFDKGQQRKFTIMQDSILNTFSFGENILFLTKHKSFFYNLDGKLLWERLIGINKNLFYANDAFINNNSIVLGINLDSLISLSKDSGDIQWSRLGIDYDVNRQIYQPKKLMYSNLGIYFKTRDIGDIYLIDYNGDSKIIMKAAGLFNTHFDMKISLTKKSLYAMDILYLRKHSLEKQTIEFEDPIIISTGQFGKEKYRNNLVYLNPLALQIDTTSGMIYWCNGRGVFCGKY